MYWVLTSHGETHGCIGHSHYTCVLGNNITRGEDVLGHMDVLR